MVQYMLGDHEAALEVLDRVTTPDGLARDVVEWHACRAQVLASVGRDEEATAAATTALRIAETADDPWALPAAHLAVARCSTGSRKEAHLERATTAAAAVGDVVAAARAVTNRTHLLLAAARYAEAVPVAREAVRLTSLVSPPGIQVSALHNLGEALAAVGELDEAAWQLRRSLTLSRALGPGRSATGLLGLGRVHRARGRSEQARAAYLEAADLARATGERQLVVQALAGLATVSVTSDPEPAAEWAREACELATPGLRSEALAAQAVVTAAWGDDAGGEAREAVAAARRVQAADRLAEALEVLGTVTADRREAVAALGEAAGIWREGGAEPAAARVEVLLGRLPGADPATRSRAREAARNLTRLGVHEVHGRPVDGSTARRVTVEVLGGFTVTVDGVAVPPAAWRSRQARTLVKLLAARRGRPVARSVVCGLLWPDDDGERTGHRLSVLLATVRGVLDPAKEWPADHYVASDAAGLWLDLRHLAVDADDVVADTSHAFALLGAGEVEVATEILADVDRRYRGDALEDEPDEEWADALREEARSAWLRAVRRLLAVRRPDGRTADTHRLLVRLLAADPYDERAHQALVTSLVRGGRHGEARRAFGRWSAAMRSIDAPLPDPSVLTPRRTAGRPRAALAT
jgi:DNA-binding SARP family transcriptional activator